MKKWKKIVLRCCIVFGALTVLLIGIWRISLRLYVSTLKKNPEKLLAYEENADGTLTITGLKPDGFLRYPLRFNDSQLGDDTYKITIPEKVDGKTVTEIGDYAFFNSYSLKNIEFPDSLTTIGDFAFWGCRYLENIEFPEGLMEIGDEAFYNCPRLENIEFPNGITTIGEKAFWWCINLEKIEFPDNAITIGDLAFAGCQNLVTVELPRSVSSMGRSVFDSTYDIRGTLRIPEGTTTIDSNFVTVTFSSGANINSEKFLEIWIPNTVTMIDEELLGRNGVCYGEHRCVFYAERGSYAASWLMEHAEEIKENYVPDVGYMEAIVIY